MVLPRLSTALLFQTFLPVRMLLSERQGQPCARFAPFPTFTEAPASISAQCCEAFHFGYVRPAGGWVSQGMNSQMPFSANSLTQKNPQNKIME